MKMNVKIGREVVTLSYSVHDGKVTVGDLSVLPVGVWEQLQARQLQTDNCKLQTDEEIHQP